MNNASFPPIKFRGDLRPSQADVVEIAQREIAEGNRRLHIVAPPGSGKTVLGLYLWAECIKQPAVVLSPNSAIQAQWAEKTDLFELPHPEDELVSTHPKDPKLLTSLTYQSVTLVKRSSKDIDLVAISSWQDKLVEKGQAEDIGEAEVWIEDLKRHNRDYYEKRLKAYRKEARDQASMTGDALSMLHDSVVETLELLKKQNVGLIILDECHHLLGHWGRVLSDAQDFLNDPMIVGLTATPPDTSGKLAEDVNRYEEFFGPINYEVPVPAVVKDGFLAPYQDLVYFVRPTQDELSYIANADDELHEIVEELCQPPEIEEEEDETSYRYDDLSPPVKVKSPKKPEQPTPSEEEIPDELLPIEKSTHLTQWLMRVLAQHKLSTSKMKDWRTFEKRDQTFADAARWFLKYRGFTLPENVPPVELDNPFEEIPEMTILVPVLDRYIRHRLRRSKNELDHQLADRTIQRLRLLGVQITEVGVQACASPVGRVMAYAQGKIEAIKEILAAEHAHLQDKIRAVVVCDFEKSSATVSVVEDVLDSEAGGAIAAFRYLIDNKETDCLDPILITGSTVLIDDDLFEPFVNAAKNWLDENGYEVTFSFDEQDGFHLVSGSGADWCPRVYVTMITELFQQGLTRCLVGTRGLLGEGWDANKVNVLIDLTTVTTSTSVNQLRGRSMRIDPDDPDKLADNWDVVCIAPEFSKGLDDYQRFIAKHKTLFGLTDDAAIEKGVGHVHAAFTELKPEGLESSMSVVNDEMLRRVTRREQVRKDWKIGEPYKAIPIRAIEAKPLDGATRAAFPAFSSAKQVWTSKSLTIAMGHAVLAALQDAKLLNSQFDVHIAERNGGYVRLFLEEADEESSEMFANAMTEVLGPLSNPRYIVERYVDHITDNWLSSFLPGILGQFFQGRKRRLAMIHAVPSELAKNKKMVEIFHQYWNKYVSPGRAMYSHRGEGWELLQRAKKQGAVPRKPVHNKEIFM